MIDSKTLMGSFVLAALVAFPFKSWLVFWGMLGLIFYVGFAPTDNPD